MRRCHAGFARFQMGWQRQTKNNPTVVYSSKRSGCVLCGFPMLSCQLFLTFNTLFSYSFAILHGWIHKNHLQTISLSSSEAPFGPPPLLHSHVSEVCARPRERQTAAWGTLMTLRPKPYWKLPGIAARHAILGHSFPVVGLDGQPQLPSKSQGFKSPNTKLNHQLSV